MTEESLHLGQRVAKGALWMIALRWAMRGLGFINMIILARLLVPDDFGVVALAMMVLALVDTFSEFRPDLALIRRQDAGRVHYDTAWTLAVLRGGLVALLMMAAAPLAADFFSEPRLEAAIYVLAGGVFVEGLRNTGAVDFLKKLDFDREFKLNVAARLGSFILTVTLALTLRSYWALIFGAVAFRLLLTLLSYRMHPFRPRLSLAVWHDIFSFSKWMWLSSVLAFVGLRSDTFVLGRLLDSTALGFYTVASRIADLAAGEFVGPIRSALFPGFAKIAHDSARLRQSFLDSFALIVLIGVPAAIGIGLVAEPFVVVVLGSRWIDSAPLIQILAAHTVLIVLSANTQSAFFAIDRPQLWCLVMSVRSVLVLPLLIMGIERYGLSGAAGAVVISGIGAFVATVFLAVRVLRVRPLALLAVTWRTAAATAAMTAAILAVGQTIPTAASFGWSLVALAALVLTGMAVFVAAVIVLWLLTGRPAGAESIILAEFRARIPIAGPTWPGDRAS